MRLRYVDAALFTGLLVAWLACFVLHLQALTGGDLANFNAVTEQPVVTVNIIGTAKACERCCEVQTSPSKVVVTARGVFRPGTDTVLSCLNEFGEDVVVGNVR